LREKISNLAGRCLQRRFGRSGAARGIVDGNPYRPVYVSIICQARATDANRQ
jgi:hypothetical protein